MPAQPAAQACSVDIGCAKDEGIEHLGLASVQLARGIGEFVVRHRQRVVGARRVVGVGPVVGRVIPGRRADAQAEILAVDQVQFGEQIDPVGDEAAVPEVAVAVVAVERSGAGAAIRRGGDEFGEGVRAALGTDAGRVLNGVVPAQLDVGVAHIDRRCKRAAGRSHQAGGDGHG